MATVQHLVQKPEKIAAAAVGILEQELVLPNLFTKQGIDGFVGAKDDTINMVVEGVLPFRRYGWRNDRSVGIQFDTYSERKIAITFGGNVYSAVKVTDEQMEMDLDGWGKLLAPQCRAVARGLQYDALDALLAAPYQVSIAGAGLDLLGAVLEARRVLGKFNAPSSARTLVVGSDFEMALLRDKRITLAQNAGDARADTALGQASLGLLGGFKVVVDQTLPSDEAYALDGSGLVWATAAPRVPKGASFGATTSFEGVALRWIVDYDTEFQQDRSVVNTFSGFNFVKDPLRGVDAQNNEFVSTSEYFVRGVKLKLGGTAASSTYPAAAGELSTITGISDAKKWTPSS